MKFARGEADFLEYHRENLKGGGGEKTQNLKEG